MFSWPTHPLRSADARAWSQALLDGSAWPRWLLVAAWVLTMISIPIIRWVIGDAALHWGVLASVLLQAAAVVALAHAGWGTRETLRVMALTLPLAWLVERVGSTTGIPFGDYHYTDALAPLLGGVPLIIPVAWLMMLPAAWAVAAAITGEQGGWRFVLLSTAAFTAWDLFLDPQMVGWGYWVWTEPGGYFGIPWSNYCGWLATAALITLIVRPRSLPVAPLLAVYTITWLLQSVGQAVFWNMPGPALCGFVGMGVFVVLSLHRLLKRSQ
jgi:putative membrane protein